MLTTTVLLYRVAVTRWAWSRAASIAFVAVFGLLDALFLASNSLKFLDGGWFPIIVGGAVAALMLCWRKGSSEVRRRLQDMSMTLDQFVAGLDGMVVARIRPSCC